MTRHRTPVLLSGLAAASLLLAACGGGGDTASSSGSGGGGGGQEVVFGVIDDVSGASAAIGTLDKKSTQMAVDDLNARGGANGRKIKMVFYDNKGDPAETARLTTRLIAQDKAVVISCCASSSAAAAAAAVAGAQKVPMLTSTVVQDLTAKDKAWYGYLFRTIPANDTLAQANVDFVKGKGYSKVALDVSSLSYGTAAIPFFEKSLGQIGAKIVAQTTLDPAVTDASIQAAQLVKANPDVIMTWDYPVPTAQLVKAVRAAGSQVPIVSNWSAINETMYTIAGTGVTNLYAHDDAVPTKPAVVEFASKWKAAYNEDAPVNNFGIFGYNIAQVVGEAVGKAKSTDAAGVRDALIGLNCFKTVLGQEDSCITFGKDNYEGATGTGFVVFKTLSGRTWSPV